MLKSLRVLSCSILISGVIAFPVGAETLEDAWREALSSDRILQATQSTEEAARLEMRATKAARLPTGEFSGGYTALDVTPALTTSFAGMDASIPFAQDNFAYYQAKASLPLYTGGKIREGIRAAEANYQAAGLDTEATELSVKLGVAENYVNVLRARSARDVADQLVMNLAAHLEDAENLLDQGLAPLNDVLAVRTALANGRENAVRASNAVDLAEAAYNRALGRPLELEVQIDDVSAGSNDLTLDMLLVLARTNRSELRAHKAREQALRHKSNAERADMAPRVGINGGYTYLENSHLQDEGVWSATVGVQWKFFDGGAARRRSNASRRQADAVRLQTEELASLIDLQVRQAWLDLQASGGRIAASQEAVAQAEENIRITRNRYLEGLSSNSDALDAALLLTQSRAGLASANYDAVMADLRVRRAAGIL